MSNYDDDESFADDHPDDLIYRVHADELRLLLVYQLSAIAEGRIDLDPQAFTARVLATTPPVSRTGHFAVDRDDFHAALQVELDRFGDGVLRRRIANEVLTAIAYLHGRR